MTKFVLVRKKERWSTTWLGKLLIILLILLCIIIFARIIHPFLAVTAPVKTDIMVIEGFMPDYAIAESMRIFNEGKYKLMIVTGKKMIRGSRLLPYENDGLLTAAILVKMGFDSSFIRVIGLENDVRKDRTFASAKAVMNWISQSQVKTEAVNVVSLGCHSRRSRLLFNKAFDHKIETGFISIPDDGYDPNVWWKTSYGFKTVINETLALVYTCFFFFPPG
jgi:hypothetical protein